MITKEDIETRKSQLQSELEQARNTMNALHGAIQDCDYWLEQLDEESNEQ